MVWVPEERFEEEVSRVTSEVLARSYPPGETKKEPIISQGEAIKFLDVSKSWFFKMKTKGVISGEKIGSREVYTPALLQQIREEVLKPRDFSLPVSPHLHTAKPYVIAVSNLKGGSGKTTVATHLSQYLAFSGIKTLLIDSDPQGSSTIVSGFMPALVDEEDHPLFPKTENTLGHLYINGEVFKPRTSYITNLDVVPAVLENYYSEFELPVRQAEEGVVPYYLLAEALNDESISNRYHAIVIDTSPSFSYSTINALYAANRLIVPTPTRMLELQAALTFFEKLREVFLTIQEGAGHEWPISDVEVLPVRAKHGEEDVYIKFQEIFENYLSPAVFAESKAFSESSMNNMTIFEGFSSRLFSRQTFKQVFDEIETAFDPIVNTIKERFSV